LLRGPRLLALTALAVLAFAPPAAAAPPGPAFAPRTWQDPLDVPGDPLDLRSVSFGQRGTHLWLRLRTQGGWSAGELAPESLCLVVAGARVCVGSDGRGVPVLRHGSRTIRATVLRPDRRSLVARLHRRAVGLRFGRVRWVVEGPGDRVPDRGSYAARIGALGQPRCFGAAARAGRRPCFSRALRRSVVPSPSRAAVLSDGFCRREDGRPRFSVLRPCEFGYQEEPQAPAIALIGDSHSAHWRSAVEVVAQARGRRAVALTHAGCSFSTEVYPAPAPIPSRCRRHGSEALRWLRAHPSVHTVVTTSSAGRGLGQAGFLAMWRRVPSTVRRILVIRDVPRARHSTAACVSRVLRRRGRSARSCAIPRGAAMIADPSADAARRRPPRVRLVDFTRHFCDRAWCYPVVGGAYVYKDDNHMNAVFATSLGPYLLRRVR
jgi:hypothetical protein